MHDQEALFRALEQVLLLCRGRTPPVHAYRNSPALLLFLINEYVVGLLYDYTFLNQSSNISKFFTSLKERRQNEIKYSIYKDGLVRDKAQRHLSSYNFSGNRLV